MNRLGETELEVEWVNGEPQGNKMLVFFWSSGCPHCGRILEEAEQISEKKQDLEPVAIHRNEYGFTEPQIDRPHDISIAEDIGTWEKLGNSFMNDFVLIENGKVQTAGDMHHIIEFMDIEHSSSIPEFQEHSLGYRGHGVNRRGNFIGKRTLAAPETRPEGEVFIEGEWEMEENHLKPLDEARMYLKDQVDGFHISAEGEGNIAVYIDGKKKGIMRPAGRSHSFSTAGGGTKELRLEPEGNIRIHAVFTEHL